MEFLEESQFPGREFKQKSYFGKKACLSGGYCKSSVELGGRKNAVSSHSRDYEREKTKKQHDDRFLKGPKKNNELVKEEGIILRIILHSSSSILGIREQMHFALFFLKKIQREMQRVGEGEREIWDRFLASKRCMLIFKSCFFLSHLTCCPHFTEILKEQVAKFLSKIPLVFLFFSSLGQRTHLEIEILTNPPQKKIKLSTSPLPFPLYFLFLKKGFVDTLQCSWNRLFFSCGDRLTVRICFGLNPYSLGTISLGCNSFRVA